MSRSIILIIFFLLLLYSCSTKDDPKVPNHSNGLTSAQNTMTFKNVTYNLAFRSCSTVDTFGTIHYMMTAGDVQAKFFVYFIFGDTTVPTSSSSYIIQNLASVTSLLPGQCVVLLQDPFSAALLKWTATDGIVNFTSTGKPQASLNNINVTCISDTSQHNIISGNTQCP
ncbi:MAG: hypothetical protein ACHQK8_07650 [Bacteroidia bacterium]